MNYAKDTNINILIVRDCTLDEWDEETRKTESWWRQPKINEGCQPTKAMVVDKLVMHGPKIEKKNSETSKDSSKRLGTI